MPEIFFTTNPSDYTKLEGLYISERNPPGFIAGADLSVTGIAGKCVRGPLTPQEITNVGRFLEMYGARDRTANGSGGARVGEVHAALLNKKFGKLVVRRVCAADAVKGTHTYVDGGAVNIIRIDAANPGAWALDVTAAVEAATDGNANHFNVRVTYLGVDTVYQNFDCTVGKNNCALVVGDDPARLIDVVKLNDGRPINASSALGTASDGTLVVGDYNNAMDDLAVYPGVSVCLVPEAVAGSAATYHSHLVTLATQATDRVFLTWAQVHGQSVANEKAQWAAQITTQTDRIIWCFNSPYTIDPDTSTELQQGPHVWMAADLSQIDVDIHPGAYQTLELHGGIKRMTSTNLQRQDLIDLRNSGISTLVKVKGGFLFQSGVTSNLTAGKTEITRRREADFLQLSAAERLRFNVKAKNTVERRAQIAAELTAFSQGLQGDGRVIEAFSIDQASVNTDVQRGQGLEKLLWRVKLIGHILYLVLETEIGEGVKITQQAA